ncbi:MAG TPA: UvrD-helicase domain-containing protein, partial [Armatimonadota bacterium]|nr:UvrD-helicase domain-containing protein [Armatimonadota bacterium]
MAATPEPACELLCGPAGSGKTGELLAEYIGCVQSGGEDSALLLLPTSLACQRTVRALVEGGDLPGLLDPRVLTFPDLADRILRANHEAVARATPWQQHLLMRSVLADLCAKGELAELGPMCEFPGFVDELCELVEEIKRAAIDPAQFASGVAASRVNDPRSRELSLIYQRYQALLQRENVYDDAGRFWQARDVLLSGRRRPFDDLRLILADGFDDFTATQLQVLRLLAQGPAVERVVAAPCLEPDQGRRPELFRGPARMLDRLRETFPGAHVRWLGTGDTPGPLVGLGADLFAESDLVRPDLPEGAVEFIEAPGRRAEVTQVALRVKSLIRGGSVAPDRIGVLARDLGAYRRALVEVFGDAGIPLHIAEQAPAASRPSVQAVLDVLRVPAEGYRCADVMRLLKSNYVDLSPLQPAEPIEPDEVERIARAAGVVRGDRDYWRERLEAYAARVAGELEARQRERRDEEEQWLRGRTEELQVERGLIERARELLRALFDRLDTLSGEVPPHQWVERLDRLVGELGIGDRVGCVGDPHLAAENLRAFDAFIEGLWDLWASDRQLGLARPMSLPDFASDVKRMAASAGFRHRGRLDDSVLAVGVLEARQLDFDHVFVLGMTEREFPRSSREDSLYSDADRRALMQAGIALEPRTDDRHREAFLFYSAVT